MKLTLQSLISKLTLNAQNVTAVVVLIIMITTTLAPFCSQLFQCGCTWPWDGLDRYCNYHNKNLADHCPWCTSLLHGYILLPLIGLMSCVVTWRVSRRVLNDKGLMLNSLISIGAGLVLFYIAAFINAWFAVQASGYPYFPF
ncbi:MAG: hypothetical protein K0U68_13260 [Gammaproteobacteria bacterium]|nr:hypothetical protein [Gammaproteobacteria bacterium]